VAISSVDVYRAYDRFRRTDPGLPDPTPLTEDSPLRDKLYPYRAMTQNEEDLMYHYDKILFERAVMSEPSLPATVLRLPMVYGPGDYQHRLFPYLKRMDDGRPAILLAEDYAAWQAPRGYVGDMGEAIALCVVKEEAAGRVYHVGDTPSVTETAWIERIAQTTGWPGTVVTRPNDQLPESLQHSYDTTQSWALDSSRIRQKLGYREVTLPSEAMQRTVEWERANPPQQIDPAAFDYTVEDTVLRTV
jgi:nucleoside-diphosphate-sugar epimerase